MTNRVLAAVSELVAGAFQGTLISLCGLLAVEGLNRGAALNHLSVAPLLLACVILGMIMFASSAGTSSGGSRFWDATVALGLAVGAMGVCIWSLRAHPAAWPAGFGVAAIAATLSWPEPRDATRPQRPSSMSLRRIATPPHGAKGAPVKPSDGSRVRSGRGPPSRPPPPIV